jgi:dihydrofolate reductase
MTTTTSRPFIAALQVTLDGYSLDSEGTADWVDSWAEGLQLLPHVDAFVLGGGMFPAYETFWTAVREDPGTVAQWLGRDPYPREVRYAEVAAETPHLVLSKTLDHPSWPTARIVRNLDELRALRGRPGGAVYVVGGDGLVRTLLDEGLLDELRLIVHPVAVGAGAALFGGIARRQNLELIKSDPATAGRLKLTYRVAGSTLQHPH